jgi:iron complex transport system substrate-binding protein
MRLRYLLFALAALLLLVAACDDDGGGGSERGASPTAAPPGATPTASQSTDVFPFSCSGDHDTLAPDASAFPLDVTDSLGNTVTLEAPPQRVVSLSAGHTEILYAIGAFNQVAAVDNTSDCPDATADLPKVDAFTPSVEAIADLEPDLVVITYDPNDLQSSLQALDIPVLNLAAPESVDQVYEQMNLLGSATGHPEEAGEVARIMGIAIDQVVEQVGEVSEPPSVFHELDTMYFTVGPGSFIGDLYDILGAENVADATGQAYPQMSAEAIIEADPDVIILADEDAGESAETVRARPGWGAVSAVENDRIYVIDPDIISRPGPRLVEALRTLAAFLYPEKFP